MISLSSFGGRNLQAFLFQLSGSLGLIDLMILPVNTALEIGQFPARLPELSKTKKNVAFFSCFFFFFFLYE